MNDTFETFTEPAGNVLSLAQDEARRLYHHCIGTEHLLLGLVQERGLRQGCSRVWASISKRRAARHLKCLSSPEASDPETNLADMAIGHATVIYGPRIGRRPPSSPAGLLFVRASILLGAGAAQTANMAQTANNIAFGMPAHMGTTIASATTILGAISVLHGAGLLLASRRLAVGVALVFVTALVCIASFLLDRTGIVTTWGPYRDTILSQGLGWSILMLAALAVSCPL